MCTHVCVHVCALFLFLIVEWAGSLLHLYHGALGTSCAEWHTLSPLLYLRHLLNECPMVTQSTVPGTCPQPVTWCPEHSVSLHLADNGHQGLHRPGLEKADSVVMLHLPVAALLCKCGVTYVPTTQSPTGTGGCL